MKAATQKPNYPECLEDPHGIATLKDYAGSFGNNSATVCASLCKKKQYIFSGTKDKLCTCGENITTGIHTSTKCDMTCPGDEKETCGGKGSVSLRRTGYVKGRTVMPRPTRLETSSEIPVTSLPSEIPVTSLLSEIPVTSLPSEIPLSSLPVNEYTGNTASVFPSTKARNIDSTIGSQMTALYITLPVVFIVAGAIALIVCLVLRYRRQKVKGNVKRLIVSASSSTYEQDSKTKQQFYNHRTKELEVKTQNINADDSCDADYSRVSDLNDTVENDQDYDELNAKPATGTKTRAIYSHLKLKTRIPNSNTTDNTYSHIGSASKVCMNKTDNTYNTVQFSLRAENTGAPSPVHDDQNSVYDITNGRDKSRVNGMSEYAHINTAIASK